MGRWARIAVLLVVAASACGAGADSDPPPEPTTGFVSNQRIVYTYDMHLNEARISVSVATVEFQKKGAGTRLVFTEQGAFLDGLDKPADREHGTGELLNALGAELKRQAAQ